MIDRETDREQKRKGHIEAAGQVALQMYVENTQASEDVMITNDRSSR